MAAFQPKLSSNANEKSEACFLTAQLDTEGITLTLGLSAQTVTDSNVRGERVGQGSKVGGKVAVQTFSNLANGFYLHPEQDYRVFK